MFFESTSLASNDLGIKHVLHVCKDICYEVRDIFWEIKLFSFFCNAYFLCDSMYFLCFSLYSGINEIYLCPFNFLSPNEGKLQFEIKVRDIEIVTEGFKAKLGHFKSFVWGLSASMAS